MSLPSGASVNADDLAGGMSQAPVGYSSAGSHLDPGMSVEPNMSVDPGISPALDPSHMTPEAGGMSVDPNMSVNPQMSIDPG